MVSQTFQFNWHCLRKKKEKRIPILWSLSSAMSSDKNVDCMRNTEDRAGSRILGVIKEVAFIMWSLVRLEFEIKLEPLLLYSPPAPAATPPALF